MGGKFNLLLPHLLYLWIEGHIFILTNQIIKQIVLTNTPCILKKNEHFGVVQ